MEINKSKEGTKLLVTLKGRLDTVTSHDLDASLKDEIPTIKDLEFEFKDLDYLSSAGLRLLLSYSKALGGKDHVVVLHPNDVLKDIFSITAFTNFVTVK
ncbi:MAG: STAS domain-containing protein [Bacilli bacterium]|jgi:anti-sigma B factor antagonist